MKIQCDVCEKAPATVICCADEAALCAKCDVEIHAANKLASKHQRLLLQCLSNKLPRCDICQVSKLLVLFSSFLSSLLLIFSNMFFIWLPCTIISPLCFRSSDYSFNIRSLFLLGYLLRSFTDVMKLPRGYLIIKYHHHGSPYKIVGSKVTRLNS